MVNKIKIQQVRSACSKLQKCVLIGLGLNKMNRIRLLEDTPCIRGMINKIRHLVKIIN